MRIEFDPAKDKLNQACHGVSLSLATKFVWDEALVGSTNGSSTTNCAWWDSYPKEIGCTTSPLSTAVKFEESSAFASPNAERSNTMSKATPKRTFVLPTAEENKKIIAAAKQDPDAKPLTSAQLKAMVPLKAVRGRPKSENKKLLVSMRYSPEVLNYFKSTGEGWQSRIDGVLREHVEKQGTRRPRKAT